MKANAKRNKTKTKRKRKGRRPRKLTIPNLWSRVRGSRRTAGRTGEGLPPPPGLSEPKWDENLDSNGGSKKISIFFCGGGGYFSCPHGRFFVFWASLNGWNRGEFRPKLCLPRYCFTRSNNIIFSIECCWNLELLGFSMFSSRIEAPKQC